MSVTRTRHILFDLDGTLIDSSRSILEGFVAALAAHGARPVVPVDSRLIGPPLPEALRILSGETDPARLAAIARSFTDYYDNEGFKASDAYAGVSDMLTALREGGATLHIATNKRFEPTRRIVDWLGWGELFDQVYAIDKLPGARFANKAAMIAHLMNQAGVEASDGQYVGDRDEDRVAATANALPFVLVTWGYGDYADLGAYPRVARTPAELGAVLLA
jgi:phosphoglycolate phosphatase